MPLLAAFIGGLITKLVDVLLELFSKKLVIAAALISALITAYIAVMAVISDSLASINYNDVPTILAYGLSMLPSNTDDCIAIIITTKAAVALYNFQSTAIKLRG